MKIDVKLSNADKGITVNKEIVFLNQGFAELLYVLKDLFVEMDNVLILLLTGPVLLWDVIVHKDTTAETVNALETVMLLRFPALELDPLIKLAQFFTILLSLKIQYAELPPEENFSDTQGSVMHAKTIKFYTTGIKNAKN